MAPVAAAAGARRDSVARQAPSQETGKPQGEDDEDDHDDEHHDAVRVTTHDLFSDEPMESLSDELADLFPGLASDPLPPKPNGRQPWWRRLVRWALVVA